jgi:AcrR family transcriptional regulator
VLAAAIAEFAATGYHGTPTESIARRAGISQPYLFRLYGTKKDLFLACIERSFDRTADTFRRAAEGVEGDERLRAMGWAYIAMLEDRELLLFQLQTYAAAADADVRALARKRYEELTEEVARLAGGERADVLPFIGQGMLLNVAAALDLEPEAWLWGVR